MSDEPEMTPISPEEAGVEKKPEAAPSAHPGVSTIRLKPVIRKPMIRKPIVGGAPKPPAPAPAAPAPAPAAAAAAPAADPLKKTTANLKKATQSLGAVTGPMPAQAVLRKTGIIAEGIITPAQQQAAKSKTSRISLESAIGVAPAKETPAPLKTIRLRRPTDLKHPAPSPLKPVESVPESALPDPPTIANEEDAPTAVTVVPPPPPAEGEATATKKTLKLHRPSGLGVKRPTLGIRKPGDEAPAAMPSDENKVGDGVAELPADIGDVPEIKPLTPLELAEEKPSGETSAGVPGWMAAISLVTTIAALIVLGAVIYFLYTEGCGPVAGENEMQFLQL